MSYLSRRRHHLGDAVPPKMTIGAQFSSSAAAAATATAAPAAGTNMGRVLVVGGVGLGALLLYRHFKKG